MPSDNARRRKKEKRYSFVFVPSDDSTHPRNYSFTRWGIVGIATAICIIFIALILSIVVYTPVGKLLPAAHPELEFVYGRQLTGIQEQLNSLLGEMVSLRAYNVRLRRALGENISREDSAFLALHADQIPTQSNHRGADLGEEKLPERPSINEPGQGSFNPGAFAEPAAQRPLPELANDLPFGSPVRGYFTRGYDVANSHFGIDIAGKEGSPVSAAAGGRVMFANWTYEDGFEMIIAHDKGYMTVYKHNQVLMKQVGDEVKRGDLIALLGSTGRTSSGPHLHFEVWKNGSVQNPMDYLINVQ